jgi:hypothetical protein
MAVAQLRRRNECITRPALLYPTRKPMDQQQWLGSEGGDVGVQTHICKIAHVPEWNDSIGKGICQIEPEN